MQKLQTIQTLSKIGKILSTIAYIVALGTACICALGLICLPLGGGEIFKLGGTSIYGLVQLAPEESFHPACATLIGWLIVCVGEAVLAKFAERYFKNELRTGTPFTLAGAREMKRLGILAIALPCGCALLATIIYSIAAEFAQVTTENVHFGDASSVTLGVMFIVMSLLCGYAAELTESMHRPELEEAK